MSDIIPVGFWNSPWFSKKSFDFCIVNKDSIQCSNYNASYLILFQAFQTDNDLACYSEHPMLNQVPHWLKIKRWEGLIKMPV